MRMPPTGSASAPAQRRRLAGQIVPKTGRLHECLRHGAPSLCKSAVRDESGHPRCTETPLVMNEFATHGAPD